MLIGLTGYAQHGKDSGAEVLVEEFGFTRLAFADTLKSMALVLNPLIDHDSHYDLEPVRLAWLVEELGWDGAKQDLEVRRFLQVLGTEAVRGHLGDDTWVTALGQKVIPGGKYVITDVRFPNEAAAVAEWGGQLWRIDRPNFDNGIGTSHPSEKMVELLEPDDILVNDGTLEDLARQVRSAYDRVQPKGAMLGG